MDAPTDADLAQRLRLVTGAAHHALSRALLAHGVTASEWLLLRELHAAGAVPQTQLVGRLGLTRGAVSKLVDRLAAKRLLVRGRGGGGDRRVQIIGLTGTGALLVPELACVADACDAASFVTLSARERVALGAILAKLAARASSV